MALPIPNVKKVPKWALITAGGVTAGALALKVFKNSPAGDAVASSGSGADVTDVTSGSGFQYGSGGAAAVIVPPIVQGASSGSDNSASIIDSLQSGNANVLAAQSAAYQNIFSDYSANLGATNAAAYGFAGSALNSLNDGYANSFTAMQNSYSSALGFAGSAFDSSLNAINTSNSGAFAALNAGYTSILDGAQGLFSTASGIIGMQGDTITGLAGSNVDLANANVGVVNSAGQLVDSAGNLIDAGTGLINANAGVIGNLGNTITAFGNSASQLVLANANAGSAPQPQAQNPSPMNVVAAPGAPVAIAQGPQCGGEYPFASDNGCYKVVCASGKGDAAKGRWHFYSDGRKVHVRDTC